MTRTLRATWVIARRDYVATVWSKTFLIFLLSPALPLLLAVLMSVLSGGEKSARHSDSVGVALMTDGTTAAALTRAQAHLAATTRSDMIPTLTPTTHPDPDQPRLSGTLDAPRFAATPDALHDLAGPIALIVDRARLERRLGTESPAPVRLRTHPLATLPDPSDGLDVARGGQFLLFFLVILFAGMMVSNMAEEKSSKVIELLTAAVPVDTIFFGKLVAILGAALTGIALWAIAGLVGLIVLKPAALPAPAVGWPVFIALGLAYFVTVFLLWGAIYLGIGAQAGSAREAQTLSMPLTLGEAVAFILSSAQVAHPDRTIGLVAAIIPWSSPFAMIGRAGTSPALWPHLLAIGWQLLAIFVTVRVGSSLFRSNILKSGPSRATSSWWRFGRPRRD